MAAAKSLPAVAPVFAAPQEKRKDTVMFKFVLGMAGLALAFNPSVQVEPNAGRWKTWVIPSDGSLQLASPPAADATAFEIQRSRISSHKIQLCWNRFIFGMPARLAIDGCK